MSIDELRGRALRLAGRTLAQVAEERRLAVPENLRRSKGWVGQLLEEALGATAASRAEPDFPHLGVELKTIPVSPMGVPKESTYVCVAPLDAPAEPTWQRSWARRKLSCVLWMPIIDPGGPLGQRLIGGPVLWRPSEEEAATLKADWELLSGLIAQGDFDRINARLGKALQLRPKAANAKEMAWVLGEEGEWVQTGPLGYYLRQRFTRALLARHLALPGS